MKAPEVYREHMRIFIATLTILFSIVPAAVVTRSQNMSGDQNLSARVDAIFSPHARADAPGCAVSVIKAGKVLYARGYGMADVAHSIPMKPNTPVQIASTSKQFTALAVLLLEGDGKLSLNDDVRQYLPEIPDFGRKITIRMLLNHTSGLRELGNLFYFAGWRMTDEQYKSDILPMLKRQRALNHVPGAEFSYNSAGYTLLALVVEKVSGVSFRRFVTDRIFTPLGMKNSDVQEDIDQVIPHQATGYWDHKAADLRTARALNSFPGPNNVITSVEDLAKWDANFYEHRVGTPAMLNLMSTPGRLPDGTEFGYGMGLFIGSYRGFRMISHAGSDPGYKADMARFPDEQLTVAVLCNAFNIPPTPLLKQVADLYLPGTDKTPFSPSTAPATMSERDNKENSADFAGLYWNDVLAQPARFLYEQGKLLFDGGGEGKFELRPLGYNAYQLVAAPRRYVLTFIKRDDSLVVRADVEGSPSREFRKVADRKPSAAELRVFEGGYFSAELDVRWTFVVRNGELIVERNRRKPTPLSPIFGNAFQAEGFVLEFRRDPRADNMILEITTERVRRLQFTRVPRQP
jgi:CubicO group peptidase (beta-lactamase class C family)